MAAACVVVGCAGAGVAGCAGAALLVVFVLQYPGLLLHVCGWGLRGGYLAD